VGIAVAVPELNTIPSIPSMLDCQQHFIRSLVSGGR